MDINTIINMAFNGWETDEELESVYNDLMNRKYTEEELKILHRSGAMDFLNSSYICCKGDKSRVSV